MDVDPRGTVTFLFTDIEGSTDLWDRDPAAMDLALRVHDGLVESAITGRTGVVFSRAGDSFAAAFASASEAVVAAAAIQRAIASQPEPFALRVRIGLHTGESYDRDHNYFGPAVNRAARLMAAARRTSGLFGRNGGAGPLHDDVSLRRLGTFRLKDLLVPETIVQVEAPGVVVDFPPLRTLDVLRHNLPVQQTRLIGREAEISATLDAFGESRLVTLTGVGGCGKTRLALAAAAEVTSSHEDGVFFVPLATVMDEDGLVAAVTQSVGVRLGRERSTDLSSFLAGARPPTRAGQL